MSIKNRLQNIIKKSLSVDISSDRIIIDVPKDKKNALCNISYSALYQNLENTREVEDTVPPSGSL